MYLKSRMSVYPPLSRSPFGIIIVRTKTYKAAALNHSIFNVISILTQNE
jgi:hypothetical protein